MSWVCLLLSFCDSNPQEYTICVGMDLDSLQYLCCVCMHCNNWLVGLPYHMHFVAHSFSSSSSSHICNFSSVHLFYSALCWCGTLYCCRTHGIRMSRLWPSYLCNYWCGNTSLLSIWKVLLQPFCPLLIIQIGILEWLPWLCCLLLCLGNVSVLFAFLSSHKTHVSNADDPVFVLLSIKKTSESRTLLLTGSLDMVEDEITRASCGGPSFGEVIFWFSKWFVCRHTFIMTPVQFLDLWNQVRNLLFDPQIEVRLMMDMNLNRQ